MSSEEGTSHYTSTSSPSSTTEIEEVSVDSMGRLVAAIIKTEEGDNKEDFVNNMMTTSMVKTENGDYIVNESDADSDENLMSVTDDSLENSFVRGGESSDWGPGDGLTRRERKNLRRRELVECKTCGKTINRGSMSKHVKTHFRIKRYKCDICGGQYDRHDYFSRHMALHIDEKPYKCSVCGKAFKVARKLIKHETIHTGLKPFVCSLCDRSFTDSSALYKHMRTQHQGDKPYECSFCGKSFNESAKVVRHMRIHTGEKPFVCEVCNRAFNDKSSMLKHVRTHKGETSANQNEKKNVTSVFNVSEIGDEGTTSQGIPSLGESENQSDPIVS